MISQEQLIDYVMENPGVTQDFPFDKDTMVIRIGNKIFFACNIVKWEESNGAINVKCDPKETEILRERYSSVTPGYHMNKRHWNTVLVQEDELPDEEVSNITEKSRKLVKEGLPKSLQDSLKDVF